MKKATILSVLAITMLSFTTLEKSEWDIQKEHSELRFKVTHMKLSEVEGCFKYFDANVLSSNDDFSNAYVVMSAQTNSIETYNYKRDENLRSVDYFEVAKYPVLSFKSITFKKVGDNKYKVSGPLTMHGITKTIEFDAIAIVKTNPMNKKSYAYFKITGTINRSDFRIGASVTSMMLSEEVIITANVEFKKL